MRSLVLVFMLLFPVSGFGQNVQIRKNVFGGFNYTENGKLSTFSRKNSFGGYTYQGKVSGYTRKTIDGNSQFIPFSSNKGNLNSLFNSRK